MFYKVLIRLLEPITRQFLQPRLINPLITNFKRLTPPTLLSGIIVDNKDDTHKSDTIIKVDENNNITDERCVVNYTSALAKDCHHNEVNVNTLIKTLSEAIVNTCEKYRKSIDQQIDIIHAGRGLNPLDSYWDGLVAYKQKADLMKAEFEKYNNLVKFVEQLSFNLSFCSAVLNDSNPVEKPCDEFSILEMKLQLELKKNLEKEQLLKKYLWDKYMEENFYW